MVDIMEYAQVAGVPVLSKHTVLFNGMQYHNAVEFHFWELKTQSDFNMLVFAREWVGKSARGWGNPDLQAWCPLSIPLLEEVLFRHHLDKAPLFKGWFELTTGDDDWDRATQDAHLNTREVHVFGDSAVGMGITIGGNGGVNRDCFLLLRRPLAKKIWDRLYERASESSPNMCIRTNGNAMEMRENNTVHEHLQRSFTSEVFYSDNVKEELVRALLHQKAAHTISPSFSEPKVPVTCYNEQRWRTQNRISHYTNPNNKFSKRQYDSLMKQIDEFIKDANYNTQNYVLDA